MNYQSLLHTDPDKTTILIRLLVGSIFLNLKGGRLWSVDYNIWSFDQETSKLSVH